MLVDGVERSIKFGSEVALYIMYHLVRQYQHMMPHNCARRIERALACTCIKQLWLSVKGHLDLNTVLLTQFGNYLSNYMISLVHNIDIANLWEIYHLDPLGGSRHAYNPEEPSGRRETSILCWKKGA